MGNSMMKELRTCAVVDLDTILENVRAICKKAGDGTKVMAVIKTDGYGHGAVPIAKYIRDEVDAFAVATVDEGIELREAGLNLPILILGYTMKAQYPKLLEYDIHQTVYTMEDAEALSRVAVAAGKKAKIHIALDTGMGRIGFMPEQENVEVVRQIRDLPGIELVGMFSHFATADETDKGYTSLQMERYDRFVEMLSAAGIEIPVKHICNSAGIMEFDHHRYDMVRAGIILYGLYPSNEVMKENLSLKPAMEWKAHVVHVKKVGPGHGISYGKTFVTTKEETQIATVCVGYGDGYPRSLSNKGRVLIHGKSVPIIGRVCMDQFMVDVTGMDVKPEDEVTLIGRDGEEFISADEIASLTGTINYEIVCDFGKRVPRIYMGNKLEESGCRK